MSKQILDWDKYIDVARQAVSEGLVLLENKNETLPFKQGMTVSIFGRIQTHYYKSGTGSGGMVNVSHVVDIPEGLRDSGVVNLNEELCQIYADWEKENPYDAGLGWGMEPWSQVEMPLTDEIVENASKKSDVALVIIGRTAGEDKDANEKEGSYCLTQAEIQMLNLVRNHFEKMVVLLNVGGLIDLHFIDSIKPDSVIIGWQGGMVGGLGTADVLTGKKSPSGRLSDSIAYKIQDYLSDKNFGDGVRNFYEDGIFVGYRYFETFAPEKVRYPFGYGKSYTSFQMETSNFKCDVQNRKITFTVKVTNTGKYAGKQVVQIYASAPKGKIEKASKVLIDFAKTYELEPEQSQNIDFEIGFDRFATFDEKRQTRYGNSFVLEEGEYEFLIGENVRETSSFAKISLEETTLETLLPAFDENVNERIRAYMPEEICVTGRTGLSLKDVYENLADERKKCNSSAPDAWCDSPKAKKLLRQFVAQMSDEELASIVRGEGMGSPLVTPGTASAFGGVSKSLKSLGLAPVCTDDGPSGMRLDCGTKAFSLPNGTLLACTFNQELNTELFSYLSLEMIYNKVDCLLGPGINIHRHPLNGRNFEYFSEDPLLTGLIATAQLKGLKTYGVGGTIKHFAGNNQEFHRHTIDSVISVRALREIYLKPFEIAVKSGFCDSIMTTYGILNGTYTAANFDLATTILRKDWGFTGVVMTDWWASITMDKNGQRDNKNFDLMVRSQNDLYMCCPNGESNDAGDNTLEALKNGTLTRGELQRAALNVCRYNLHSQAFLRSIGLGTEVEIINRPKETDDIDMSNVNYRVLDKKITVSLEEPESAMGSSYVLAFDVQEFGDYKITLRGSSTMSELAQMSCTYFFNGFPISTVTFNGTGGKIKEITRIAPLISRFSIMRLFVGANGLKLHDITFEKVEGPVDAADRVKIY